MSHSTALLTKIQSLETMLHQPLLRNDSVTVEKLLHDDFEEIGRSGQRYNKGHTIAALQEETGQVPIYAENFKLSTIAEGVVLLTYRSFQRGADGNVTRSTFRSSIWLRSSSENDDHWQMRFHQGTPTAE
ncbi:DUF4440 domain-containing protein [Serratia liquefaciens]|uniref:nuclear transport factor 2 family protein n=1 Tax=Serratia liquefaciens TaxID=614 RepID=UPI0010221C21|nr:nuclear transport factor 2 family protein [Serratia liquefaciens]MDU3935997.1 nuclear transport factor 2 family protein [Serratia liquefaciens]RYM65538.1 DUF4440 domain-containing protein [Serratia liquefaciens]CAI2432591.1 Uncharacterized protein conserved in bacteria [Serratia liquefaciens]HEJ7883778.1 nuclear transport factor 2 family protein [Serratia liquefaciens]